MLLHRHSSRTVAMTFTKIPRLVVWSLFVSLPLFAMAVDRTKFRTCEQTSFCRRHRQEEEGRRPFPQYQLLPETLEYHPPTAQDLKPNAAASADTSATNSLWSTINRHLMGGGSQESSNHAATSVLGDPYVHGPTPTLTGRIAVSDEATLQLQFALTALQDGLVRMRITEVYDDMPARVTYDDLVLVDTPQTRMVAATHTTLFHTVAIGNASDAAAASHSPPVESREILQKITGKDDVNNHVALQYSSSNDSDAMMVVIRLNPLALYLYRVPAGKVDPSPIVTLGNDNAMYFEIRRQRAAAARKLEEVKEEKVGEAEQKPEKEIVGYWEDGLAIYADGSREEKKKALTEEEVAEEHRKLLEQDEVAGLWEEKFGDHLDSKPHGPVSVGMDITFRASSHLFGLPEHASSTMLKTTRGPEAHYKEPYRLYNLDVFEYELDETMALYGAVPLIVSQSATAGTAGVFWFNPTETFVDIKAAQDGTTSYWMSESGVMDVFLLPGPDPASVYKQYATLTGTTPLPPIFSLGYHQCRWNYKDEKDVYQVHDKFEEYDYPYDVLWLDIEHTDGKRYFTWDQNLFPNPEEMIRKLALQGRKMVTIIDPHIKRDDQYYIHKEATAKGLYIKDKTGTKDYDGWCWPGSSSYLDFTNAKVRSWWADQFGYGKYKGSFPTLYTWNDMNEPSVFNGPEVSMQKDLLNLAGEEHREWHNLYGMLFHRATGEGQVRRNAPDENIRPFVLSRAFFAGSQRYGSIWTGDNLAAWSHLEIAAPMLLGLNVAALSFVGADVGGFFGNPDAELFTRWMQAGAYQPFFRGHAHHDSKRREPWMFGEETLKRLRHAAMARYALLPYWYTIFHFAEVTGMPVMRTMWMQYPQLEELYGIDDQYMIGSDLLVKPITSPGATTTTVQFPNSDLWYNAQHLDLVKMPTSDTKGFTALEVPADIDTIPVFQRGGSIIPRKLRLRRSTLMMRTDPYTLYIALNASKEASGSLYTDDEESFNYIRKDEYGIASFTASFDTKVPSGTVSAVAEIGKGWTNRLETLTQQRMIERIVILGFHAKAPSSIKIDEDLVEFNFDGNSRVLVIRKPNLSALDTWVIKFTA
jgi:mannosyl-oligosaccharide alpha-1,3-glucosidase